MSKPNDLRLVVLCAALGLAACSGGNGDARPDAALEVGPMLDAGAASAVSSDTASDLPDLDAPEQPGLDAGGDGEPADAGAARFVIQPSGPQFFAASLGVPSTPITFGVANAGHAAVGPIRVSVTGPYAADFAVVTNTCVELAPLAGCSVAVVFTPTAADACIRENATLVVDAPGSDVAPVSVELRDWHSSPNPFHLAPAEMAFAAVAVGATGAPVTFTLTYSGCPEADSGPLSAAVSAPDFMLTADTCSGMVPTPGASCSVSVASRPTSPGTKTATLTVSRASGSVGSARLTGTGLDSALDGSVIGLAPAPGIRGASFRACPCARSAGTTRSRPTTASGC